MSGIFDEATIESALDSMNKYHVPKGVPPRIHGYLLPTFHFHEYQSDIITHMPLSTHHIVFGGVLCES